MKFAQKITLTFVVLLAAALGAVGLAMTGMSFARSLDAARSAAAAQLGRDAYGVEQAVFGLYDAYTARGAQPYGNVQLAAAMQAYATEGAPDAQLALWVDGSYSLFSTLHSALPRTALQAVAAGDCAMLCRTAGGPALVLARPLTVPGRQAVLLGVYDVSAVFDARRVQLLAWLGATAAALALGALAARWLGGRLTAPLTRLQAASTRMAAGDYAGRTGVVTDDEIGALSASFDRMAEAVETRVGQLNAALQRERDFVAAFTHELKTPMTGMMGYAALLRRGPQDAETQAEAADTIYRETRRLEALSRKLLALLGLESAAEAGDDALTRAPVTDHALFAGLQRAFAGPGPDATAGTPLRFEPAGCRVAVDRVLWEDLLRNLIRNALTACRGKPGATVTVACRAEDGCAVFTVADTGCGIPPEDLPRLTEPFYMVDKSRARKQGGSGLGLALCERIAAAHGTRLEFSSEPGHGTTVTVRLPLVCDAAAGDNAPARPGDSAAPDKEVTPDAN